MKILVVCQSIVLFNVIRSAVSAAVFDYRLKSSGCFSSIKNIVVKQMKNVPFEHEQMCVGI